MIPFIFMKLKMKKLPRPTKEKSKPAGTLLPILKLIWMSPDIILWQTILQPIGALGVFIWFYIPINSIMCFSKRGDGNRWIEKNRN